MAKRQYSKPQAEKVDFDYVESVVACPSGCADPSHVFHAGATWPSCAYSPNNNNNNNNNNDNNNNNNNNGGGNSYYAPGWGLPCS